ncbi:MAG TPA: hypothetical protein VFO33_03365 [Casimicrobiaceae bacterium]|nr:hypothetical protein [Casimicrobiaceae bacterium]
MPSFVLPFFRSASATARILALSLLLPLSAQAADYTDLWWNPSESGWGVNLVQSDNFMFLTFFIYGADNKPTWFTALLTADSQGAYSGGLYATVGTYYAKPWSTGDAIPGQLVGSAQFKPSTSNSYQATLTYVVNGVGTVIKAIERQSLTAINIGGAYTGGLAGVQSGCSNAGSYKNSFDLQVNQTTAGAFSLAFTFPTYACTLSGTLVQNGTQYNAANAEYKCTQGNTTVLSTSANIAELKATAQGIEGRWVAGVGGGCVENAYFSAVLL